MIQGPEVRMNDKMKGKVCIVTGASSGIGRRICIKLAEQGAVMLMLCRSKDKGLSVRDEIIKLTGNKNIELYICDISLQKSVRNAVRKIRTKYSHIDVLINNAGILIFGREFTEEGFEKTAATNHIGPFLLTNLILKTNDPEKRCRIINVVSEGANTSKFDADFLKRDTEYKGIKAYTCSKKAQIYFTYRLAEKLKGSKATANCFYPGLVRTGLGRPEKGFFRFTHSIMSVLLKSKFIPVEEAVRPGIFLAGSRKAENMNGCYLKNENGNFRVIKKYDRTVARKIWKQTSELILNKTQADKHHT